MKKYLLLSVLLLTSTGCALIPPHAVNLDIKGHNLETVYGKLEDGEIHVHTIWGNKASSFITPTDTNTGTSANTAIPVTVTVAATK